MTWKNIKYIPLIITLGLAPIKSNSASQEVGTIKPQKDDKGKLKKQDKSISSREVNLDSYADINKAFSIETKKLLAFYNFKRLPLTAEILDSSNEKVKFFLENELKYSMEHPLATHYFPAVKVDNKEASFCLIYYDSKDNLFKSYESMKNLSKYESLQYLTWHEMGHCFGRYENYSINERKNEEFADEFAVAVALNNNQGHLAKRIVKQVSYIDKDSIHGNGDKIESFYSELIGKRIFVTKKNINQILEVVTFYNSNGNLNNFRFKSPLMRTEPASEGFVEPPKGKVQFIDKNYTPK